MANILIIDNDLSYLPGLQKKLPTLDIKLNLIPANSVREAIQKLDMEDIDLVVCELELPEINGFELLTYLNKHLHYLPVIVTSNQAPTDLDVFLEENLVFQYLPKPFDGNTLIAKITEGLTERDNQTLREVFLPSFVRLLSQQKKSYTLIVQSNLQTGFLYFNQGELFDAETDHHAGLEAAYEIFSWRRAEVLIDFKIVKQERMINFELEEILFQEPKQANSENVDVKRNNLGNRFINQPEKKEVPMNVRKIQAGIKSLQEDVGDGLIATDFWTIADGLSLAGYNVQPKAVALFNKITEGVSKALKGAGFPGLGRYYFLDLEDGKLVIVLPLGKYQWGMLIDGQKVQLGVLLNIALPHAFEAYESATKE